MSQLPKTDEAIRINAIRHRIHELEGIWVGNRVIRSVLKILEPIAPPPVDPWEKYRDMKGSGE